MSYVPDIPQTTVIANQAFTNVLGTAGSYDWCMPVQGTVWKRVVIGLNNYTNTSTSTITFPTAFAKVPITLMNNTGLVLTNATTTAFTIPIAVAASGTITLEGF